MNAWIETPDGHRIALEGNCYFGRAPVNTVHLQSAGASRRHALIHSQQSEGKVEYWLADLGSTNGTLCNARRITIPLRLKDGDVIGILGENFTFRRDDAPATETASPFKTSSLMDTVVVRTRQPCWLLMLDIKRYTSLSCQFDPDTLAVKVGQWLRRSRDVVESSGGVVDKFLGDAIFAYWRAESGTVTRVATAIQQLTQLQQSRDPDFRLVVHYGEAAMEGGAGGADNMSGPDVIMVFRMEKVCSKLGSDSILSARAVHALGANLACGSLGQYPLDGFTGTFEMFKLQ